MQEGTEQTAALVIQEVAGARPEAVETEAMQLGQPLEAEAPGASVWKVPGAQV
jgi:hypothetical protein